MVLTATRESAKTIMVAMMGTPSCLPLLHEAPSEAKGRYACPLRVIILHRVLYVRHKFGGVARVTAHEVTGEEEPLQSPADPASPEGAGDWVLVDVSDDEPTPVWALLEDERSSAKRVRGEPGDTGTLNAGA